MSIAEWVKTERERRGWTQEQLAQRMSADAGHVTRNEVINIEKGRNQASSARIRAGLNRAFGPLPRALFPEEAPAAIPSNDSPRPLFRNHPLWEQVRAAVLETDPILRTRPQAVDAAGDTSALLINELTPDMVQQQAHFWLQHAKPDRLEQLEALRIAGATAREREEEEAAEALHAAARARGETPPPVHQILRENRKQKRSKHG